MNKPRTIEEIDIEIARLYYRLENIFLRPYDDNKVRYLKSRIAKLEEEQEQIKEELLAIEAKTGIPYKSYGINLTELNKEK